MCVNLGMSRVRGGAVLRESGRPDMPARSCRRSRAVGLVPCLEGRSAIRSGSRWPARGSCEVGAAGCWRGSVSWRWLTGCGPLCAPLCSTDPDGRAANVGPGSWATASPPALLSFVSTRPERIAVGRWHAACGISVDRLASACRWKSHSIRENVLCPRVQFHFQDSRFPRILLTRPRGNRFPRATRLDGQSDKHTPIPSRNPRKLPRLLPQTL